jgi:methyltransferase OMS1
MTLRSRLVKQARGDVLESAAGTGRNSEYYVQSRVKSLTIVDKSKGMLEIAEQKWPAEREGEDWTGRVQFLVGDVEDEGTRARLRHNGSPQFDTVVQTLGLCSTDDPDALMRSLTKLVKPGGKILLLEHGQSYFDGLNRMLDRSAHSHAAKHGCFWNRDIGAIVARSGMETVQVSRTWRSAGTNWYVILRKPLGSRDTIEDATASSSH